MTTQTESIIGKDKVMDVRPIPCSIKHGLILKTWRELPVGDHFILLNDHDPVPLRYQFDAEFPGACAWEYLEQGPAGARPSESQLMDARLRQWVGSGGRDPACPQRQHRLVLVFPGMDPFRKRQCACSGSHSGCR